MKSALSILTVKYRVLLTSLSSAIRNFMAFNLMSIDIISDMVMKMMVLLQFFDMQFL